MKGSQHRKSKKVTSAQLSGSRTRAAAGDHTAKMPRRAPLLSVAAAGAAVLFHSGITGATSSLFASAFSVVKTKTGSKVHHQNQYQNRLLSMNQNLAGTGTKYKDRLHLHDYLTPPDTNTIMSQQSGNQRQPFSELQIPPVPALKDGNKKICDTFVGCYRVPENLTITVDAARFVPEPDNPNKPLPLPFPTTPEKCATYCYETGLWPEMVYIADAGNTCLCSVQGPETEELRREFGVVSNTVCRKASCEEMSVDDDNIGSNLAQTYEKKYCGGSIAADTFSVYRWRVCDAKNPVDNPVDNVCRCDFGHGATGVDCQVDNVVKCMDCHDGYHLNETDPHAIHADCEENRCTCENGQGATNRQCPTHDLPKCVACDDHNGYTLDHEMCRLRQCTCKDGTADIGIPCEIDGHASCASCDPGYWLPNGTKHLDGGCQRKQCTCHNGFPTNGTACPAHSDEFCSACDPGYYLLPNNTCALKICTCANGVAAEGVDCPTNAIEFCTACDEPGGYVLEENKCNRRHCTCEHGKERWGLPCTVDGEHQCASCDAGFSVNPPEGFSVLAAGAQDSICAGTTAIQSATGDSKYEANAVSGGYWSLKTCEALCENEPACGFLAFSEGKLCALFEQCMQTALHRGAVVYKKASFDVDLRSKSGKSDVTTCGSKACVCAHGTPTSGAECPAVAEEFCDKCDRGYHMEGSFLDYTLTRRCDENACTCPHGTGARVEECEKHGALKCVACDEADGFFLEDHHCRLRKCTCDNGVGELGKLCSEEQNHECHPEKCQPGHYFKNTTTSDQKTFCPLKECSCEHGLGFKGIQCETHAAEKCESCSEGYHLEGVKCVENLCACENGEPTKGLQCPVHGEKGCVSCDGGFHMLGGEPAYDAHGCPAGTEAVSFNGNYLGPDIGGCGLYGCGARYKYENIEACRDACEKEPKCKGFNFAPKNGDRNHRQFKVCTLYNRDKPTSMWPGGDGKYHALFCKMKPASAVVSPKDAHGCPAGSKAVEFRGRFLGPDIGGCGLHGCGARYKYESIEACRAACKDEPRCKAFNYAPENGDRNHRAFKVCTLYDRTKPNQLWPGGDGKYHALFCEMTDADPTPHGGNFGKECKLNECHCDFGKGATGEDCPKHAEPKCSECNDALGYTLDTTDFSCREKQCSCSNGTGGTGPECPEHETETCVSCDAGFHQENAACVENVCTCPNGEEVREKKCPHHEDKGCKNCNPGFHMVGSIAIPDAYGCPLGSQAVAHKGQYYGADIGGCGLFGCAARYKYDSIDSCFAACKNEKRCKAFNWAPENGDKNHRQYKICTLYDRDTPNQLWPGGDGKYHQVLCKMGGDATAGIDSVTLRGSKGSEKIKIGAGGKYTESIVLSTDPKPYALPASVGVGEEFSIQFLNDNGPRDVFVEDGEKLFQIKTAPRAWPKCPSFTSIFSGGRCSYVRRGVFAWRAKYILSPREGTAPGRECKVNACFCENGKGCEGIACLEHGNAKCASCDEPAGYVLDKDACREKECSGCQNGKAAVGTKCPHDGDGNCAECDKGFHLEGGDDKCEENVCSCKHGKETSGEMCYSHGKESCEKCDSGYHKKPLDGGAAGPKGKAKGAYECGLNHCKCENGTPTEGEACPKNKAKMCQSCNEDVGYSLAPDKTACEERQCLCEHGEAAKGKPCPKTGAQMCVKCEPGFHLEKDEQTGGMLCKEPAAKQVTVSTGQATLIGCFKDNGKRSMKRYMGSRQTVASCKALCSHYDYFALQAGHECRCANRFEFEETMKSNKYGKSKSPTECNLCEEDKQLSFSDPKAKMCGGGWRNSVYEHKRDIEFVGCFRDKPERAMLMMGGGGDTLDSCFDKCSKINAPYSALQWGNQCACGFTLDETGIAKYGKIEDKECSHPARKCKDGANFKRCGGGWSNAVYRYIGGDEQAELPSCGTNADGYSAPGWRCPAQGNNKKQLQSYKYFQTSRNFKDASNTCWQYGAVLAIAETEEQAKAVAELIGSKRKAYLSANDRHREKKFVHADGEVVDDDEDDYAPWNNKEPNNWKNEDCVEFKASNGKWNDIDCGQKRDFVCSKPFGSSGTTSYVDQMEVFTTKVGKVTYRGCFKDNKKRAMKKYKGYGMTVESCKLQCSSYRYFAIQASSQCRCSNEIEVGRHLDIVKNVNGAYSQASPQDCRVCRDYKGKDVESGLQCGGGWRNSIYEHEPDIEYVGCYIDKPERAMKWLKRGATTMEECADKCLSHHYDYFAMQWGTQCFCGNEEHVKRYGGKQPDEQCSVKKSKRKCHRESNFEYCGGGWRNAVYKLKGGTADTKNDRNEGQLLMMEQSSSASTSSSTSSGRMIGARTTTTAAFKFNNGFEQATIPQCTPTGWRCADGIAYKYFSRDHNGKPLNFADAEDFCNRYGATLATIQTDFQNYDALTALVGKRWPYIGASDRKKEGRFVWTSDGKKVEKKFWNRGEPNNWNKKEDCAVRRARNGKWNDINCNRKRDFVCSKPEKEPEPEVFDTAVGKAKYLGCFKDNGKRNLKRLAMRGATLESCKVACSHYDYFALQGSRHECWCGNKGFVDVESASDAYMKVADGDCNECKGMKGRLEGSGILSAVGMKEQKGYCGGGWRNSIYQHESDVEYVGCFKDNGARQMKLLGGGHTFDTCMDKCGKNNYNYFGLQWGDECTCSMSRDGSAEDGSPGFANLGQLEDAACTRPDRKCRDGALFKYCGGGWSNAVYRYKQPEDSKQAEFPSCTNSGWRCAEGRAYKFLGYFGEKNFNDAQNICWDYGATLATITSKEQNVGLGKFIGKQDAMIGYNDNLHEKRMFKWADSDFFGHENNMVTQFKKIATDRLCKGKKYKIKDQRGKNAWKGGRTSWMSHENCRKLCADDRKCNFYFYMNDPSAKKSHVCARYKKCKKQRTKTQGNSGELFEKVKGLSYAGKNPKSYYAHGGKFFDAWDKKEPNSDEDCAYRKPDGSWHGFRCKNRKARIICSKTPDESDNGGDYTKVAFHFPTGTAALRGCFQDNKKRSLKRFVGNGFTPSSCKAQCTHYELFSIQAGRQCFCGNKAFAKLEGIDDYEGAQYRFGVAEYTYKELPPTQCALVDPHDISRGLMGAGWKNSVYEHQPDVKFVGCFRDGPQRAMKMQKGQGWSLDRCMDVCQKDNYDYFALQWGSECACGNGKDREKYGGPIKDSDCSHPGRDCAGGAWFERCGGSWSNAVYEYVGVGGDDDDAAKNALAPSPPAAEELESCQAGWRCVEGMAYKYFPQRKSFRDAENACKSVGGHLAKFETVKQNELANELLPGKWDFKTAIGLNDKQKEGKFFWADGSKFRGKLKKKSGDSGWEQKEPNNWANKEDCAIKRFPIADGKWFDISCKQKFTYMCSKRACVDCEAKCAAETVPQKRKYRIKRVAEKGGDWHTLSCPSGYSIVGGGCNAYKKPWTYEVSAPTEDGRAWKCGGNGGKKKVYAVCVRDEDMPGLTVVKSTGGDWHEVQCPREAPKILSGGCDVQHGRWRYEDSAPRGTNGWACGGHGGKKTVFAICSPEPDLPTTTMPGWGKDWAKTSCPDSYALIGGGCDVNGGPHKIQRHSPKTSAVNTYTCGGHGPWKKVYAICLRNVVEEGKGYAMLDLDHDDDEAEALQMEKEVQSVDSSVSASLIQFDRSQDMSSASRKPFGDGLADLASKLRAEASENEMKLAAKSMEAEAGNGAAEEEQQTAKNKQEQRKAGAEVENQNEIASQDAPEGQKDAEELDDERDEDDAGTATVPVVRTTAEPDAKEHILEVANPTASPLHFFAHKAAEATVEASNFNALSTTASAAESESTSATISVKMATTSMTFAGEHKCPACPKCKNTSGKRVKYNIKKIESTGGDWHSVKCPPKHSVIGGGCDNTQPPHLMEYNAPDNKNPRAWKCGGHGGRKKVWVMCVPDMEIKLQIVSQKGGDWFRKGCPRKTKAIGGGCQNYKKPWRVEDFVLEKNGWICGGHGGKKRTWAICTPELDLPVTLVNNWGYDWARATCPKGSVLIGGGCNTNGHPNVFSWNGPKSGNKNDHTFQCGGHGAWKEAHALCLAETSFK